MQKHLLFTTLYFTLLISGCASYPEHGSGGLAESYQNISYENADFSPVMPDEPLGPEHGMRFDWQLAKLHLDSLIREGAKWCFPASVVQALELQNRIARELHGGLLLDAANDLVIQRKRLHQLEQQLDYVLSHTRCVPPRDEDAFRFQLDMVNELYDILNIDNQFAVNSAEINPKYMGHLAKAANILREHTTLTLTVTGHADASGNEAYNEKLAMDRAEQVKRYLAIFGLDPNRITTYSLGEKLPLFDGESAAVRLTNRRVSIEIQSPANTEPSPYAGGVQ
ncbi:OmpA family protein [Vibrio vulnificus]|uniref:OmpA family protein n=1 Tax=Vibrio vulnificus TaxID=672 RepID=UPI001D1E850E|nr:OmpA family protein [Vibrio vulnificus]EIZ1050684.1 OmpA family protein [Vibrio vulnificus]EIZ1352755.1 OmpA family protein [Vibrio vulnificus]ELK5318646.1 OmpA family protein [Vibrio vulnificus]ELQ2334564.1 OmpA family protein [Vibrio vulnificus]